MSGTIVRRRSLIGGREAFGIVVDFASTANLTIATGLNAGDVVDGVTLVNGMVGLIKDQSTGGQNGFYQVGPTPVRHFEFSMWDSHLGRFVAVKAGTANKNTVWVNTNSAGGTLGTTAIAFSNLETVLGAVTSVNIQYFAASGTYTPTANMLFCIVEAVGAGGGGGSGDGDVAGGTGSAVGAGGGSGGYSRSKFTAAQIGASKAVAVGAGGAGGAAGVNDGAAGGNTTFGSTLLVANGGAGGEGPAFNTTTQTSQGALGGTAGTGDLTTAGMAGTCGIKLSNSSRVTGAGGSSAFGGGGRGVESNAAATEAAGVTAPGYGGGGGGGLGSTDADVAGGDGKDGYLMVTEFIGG